MPKLAVPATAEDLQDALTNKATLNTLISEGSFPEFMTNYVAEFGLKNKDVDEQVNEAVERAMASYARDRGAELLAGGGKRKATAADVRAQRQSASYKSDKFGAGAKLDGK